MKRISKIMILTLVVTFIVSGMVTATSEAKAFTQAGWYYTDLKTKDNKKNQFDSYAKKFVLRSKTFTLYGTMHYKKPGDVYTSKIYKKAKRTYILASNCKYYKEYFKNGRIKKKKISKKKFKKLALPLTKGNYGNRTLSWDIKGGKVTNLTYQDN